MREHMHAVHVRPESKALSNILLFNIDIQREPGARGRARRESWRELGVSKPLLGYQPPGPLTQGFEPSRFPRRHAHSSIYSKQPLHSAAHAATQPTQLLQHKETEAMQPVCGSMRKDVPFTHFTRGRLRLCNGTASSVALNFSPLRTESGKESSSSGTRPQ